MFGSKKGTAQSTAGSGGGDDFWGADNASDPNLPAPPEIEPINPYESSGKTKTLLEFLDPLFLKICGLHRVQASGGTLFYDTVRLDIEELLSKLDKDANSDTSLRAHFDFLNEPIKWFLDCIFGTADSRFPREFWQTWQRNYLGEERESDDGGTLTGGDLFFDDPRRGLDYMLDESKGDRNDPVANERLIFYYTCIGLGLQGRYYEAPEKLKAYMEKIYPRIGSLVDNDPEGMLTPGAYENPNTKNFVAITRDKPMILVAAFVAFIFTLIIAYTWLYGRQVSELNDSIKAITQPEIPSS